MTEAATSVAYNDSCSIAVIGMAGRFADAHNLDEFWQNLRNGVESIRTFTDEELAAAGVAKSALEDGRYVRRGSLVPDFERFDAEFFGFNPRDAELADPQQRVFMEVAWEALEHAGYVAGAFPGAVGVFAGGSGSVYYMQRIHGNEKLADSASEAQLVIGNEKDYLCSRVAYHLGLRGPAVTVQTACSTSLVAVHLACQSILNGESDLAMAGGSCIRTLRPEGYLYQEGDILSPDGHCRAFDAQAGGTVPGNGVGLVVLKSLGKALEDGDTIHAVIRGSAINNDAADKVGFTAPSINGQAAVITEAMAVADVHPETISFVEAHGTGTVLGDPIEIQALQQAYAGSTDKKQFCAVGSLKTNIGHLDTAAGIAGLIKSVLSLKHRELPASLHFTQSNPHIKFEDSPFFVNAELREFAPTIAPLRAAVSSFGIGGTNAHVVLEEAPPTESAPSARSGHVLLLSAKTPEGLAAAGANLAQFLDRHPDINLADAAFTTQVGRKAFGFRRAIACTSVAAAVHQLQAEAPSLDKAAAAKEPSVVFMFPGQGSQYPGMGRELYRTEKVFRTQIDRCATLLLPVLGFDLRDVLYPEDESAEDARSRLRQTQIAQPALFAVGYALARQLESWGVRPHAMVGHSLGEYIAACLAGVFRLEHVLVLVARRGQLMTTMQEGRMLAVHASEQQLRPLLESDTWIAALNAPAICTVSGSDAAITALEGVLGEQGIEFQALQTSHAFHSAMMDPIIDHFVGLFAGVTLSRPRIKYLSNVTGTWITAEQACSAAYWGQHLRQTVRFSDCVRELLEDGQPVFVEVGPGRTLSSLVRQQTGSDGAPVVPMLASVQSVALSAEAERHALGQLWVHGVDIAWAQLYVNEKRRRIPLPTYPFQRKRHWIDIPSSALERAVSQDRRRRADIKDWFYAPAWKRTLGLAPESEKKNSSPRVHLVLADRDGVCLPVLAAMRASGDEVLLVAFGSEWVVGEEGKFEIDPDDPAHYESLLSVLAERGKTPNTITNFWSLGSSAAPIAIGQNVGFHSMRLLSQALSRQAAQPAITINLVSNGLFNVTGGEFLAPEKAIISGLCKALRTEHRNVLCRTIDIVLSEDGAIDARFAGLLARELGRPAVESVVAYRGSMRWIPTIESARSCLTEALPAGSRAGGHYLVTDAFGGGGFVFARYLAETCSAPTLTLMDRTALPPKGEWQAFLGTHSLDHPDSRKIRQMQSLEALGARLVYVAGDADDEQAVRQLTDSMLKAGPLRGIFYGAGTAGMMPLHAATREHANQSISARMAGLLNLSAAFDFDRLDFVILWSSIGTVLPMPGRADATAADTFLDAFAQQASAQGRDNIMSVNWIFWKDDEEVVRKRLPTEVMREGSGLAELLSSGIEKQEAKAIFDLLLSARLPQVIVSPLHIDVTAEHIDTLNAFVQGETTSGAASTGRDSTRPALAVAYVAPRNEIEEKLADIWQGLFGMSCIGVHDDFFDLGGHSLMATQVIAQVRQRFQAELPLRAVFDATTVATLAALIESALQAAERDAGTRVAEAKDLLQKNIDAMSPDEISSLLAEKRRLKALRQAAA